MKISEKREITIRRWQNKGGQFHKERKVRKLEEKGEKKELLKVRKWTKNAVENEVVYLDIISIFDEIFIITLE